VSKPSDNILLVPGEAGWEIWSGSPGGSFVLHSQAKVSRASEITDIPNGNLVLLFPVKAITALPLRVTTEDSSLFPEMAAMHAERQGLRPDPMAGQLTDQFVVAKEGDTTSLLSVILRTPGEGDMPPRGPKEFDLSARAIGYQGDSLVFWKEFGRWVFALSVSGKLVYCQATAIDLVEPDAFLAREAKLSALQLSMQGVRCDPARAVVYSETPFDVSALESALGLPVQVMAKPAPILPEPRSKLLPDDVRAARREARRRQQIMAAVALLVLAYVGTALWFGFSYWKENREIASLLQKARTNSPDTMAYEAHVAKWSELEPVVDLNKSPVELLYRVAREMPKGKIRLTNANISGSEIKLQGGAEYATIKQFDLALTKSNQLVGYRWENQEPNNSSKGWTFQFAGFAPGATGTQP
jgi:hypothetical protein